MNSEKIDQWNSDKLPIYEVIILFFSLNNNSFNNNSFIFVFPIKYNMFTCEKLNKN